MTILGAITCRMVIDIVVSIACSHGQLVHDELVWLCVIVVLVKLVYVLHI